MKALSIREPYATLIALGLKHIETRSWKTAYRGPICIHVPLKDYPGWQSDSNVNFVRSIFNHGEIVMVADLVDCVPTETVTDETERQYGFYDSGRFGWVLENIRYIEPFKVSGKLGLFEIEYNNI